MKDRFETSVKKVLKQKVEPLQDKESVWEAIEQKLHKRRVRRLYIVSGIAATILLLITISIILFSVGNSSSKVNDYYCGITSELSASEYYYATLIEEKKQQVKAEGIRDEDMFNLFYNELDSLDKQYGQYKNELKKYGYQEELIRAMILNQQQKLEILNKLLSEIKKIKSYENRKKHYSI